jgi:hypothetical protein
VLQPFGKGSSVACNSAGASPSPGVETLSGTQALTSARGGSADAHAVIIAEAIVDAKYRIAAVTSLTCR